MFESDIELKLADCPEQVAAIVKEMIQKVYLHYYPSGAVQFFLDLHSAVRIKEVMYSEEIYRDWEYPEERNLQIIYFAGILGKRIWKQIDGFTGSTDF